MLPTTVIHFFYSKMVLRRHADALLLCRNVFPTYHPRPSHGWHQLSALGCLHAVVPHVPRTMEVRQRRRRPPKGNRNQGGSLRTNGTRKLARGRRESVR